MNEKGPPPAALALVMWIIWFALFAAVPFYVVFLGGGWSSGKNAAGAALPIIFFVGLFQLAAATAVRWFVLPRSTRPPQQLVWMVLGLSLSEGPVFYSIFLIPRSQPETKTVLLVLCVLSMLQFAPFYARAPKVSPFHAGPTDARP